MKRKGEIIADEYVEVTGLRQAVLLSDAVNFPIRVELTEVVLRQAPALREVLAKAARPPQLWDIVNDVKLHQVFYTAVAAVGNLLRRHGNHIHLEDMTIEWLRGNIGTMEECIPELKGLVVHFRPHGHGGGDDGEEDDAPEEKEATN